MSGGDKQNMEVKNSSLGREKKKEYNHGRVALRGV